MAWCVNDKISRNDLLFPGLLESSSVFMLVEVAYVFNVEIGKSDHFLHRYSPLK